MRLYLFFSFGGFLFSSLGRRRSEPPLAGCVTLTMMPPYIYKEGYQVVYGLVGADPCACPGKPREGLPLLSHQLFPLQQLPDCLEELALQEQEIASGTFMVRNVYE